MSSYIVSKDNYDEWRVDESEKEDGKGLLVFDKCSGEADNIYV